MVKQSTKVENLFTNPEVAETTPPYVFIDAFGVFVAADGYTTNSEQEMLSYLNRSEIDARVDAYLDYIDAHADEYYAVPAKKAVSKRDGTVVPAKAARLLSEKARSQLKTRVRQVVADFVAFEYAAYSE